MYKTIVATSIAALLTTSALAQQAPRDAGSAPPAGAPSVNEKATAPTTTPTNEKAIRIAPPTKPGVSEGTDRKGTKSSAGAADQPKAAGTAEPKAAGTVEPPKASEATDQKPAGADKLKTVEPKASSVPATKGAEKTDTSTPAQRSGLGGAKNNDAPTGSVVITPEHRTQIQSAFVKHRISAPKVTINLEPRVGIVVPRKVTLVAIPEDIIVIVPEYRRYKYFVIADKICIVDTATYTIVDVIILA